MQKTEAFLQLAIVGDAGLLEQRPGQQTFLQRLENTPQTSRAGSNLRMRNFIIAVINCYTLCL